jgi:CDP-4-dehydro-6-deoxyglucose reductase
VLQDHADLSGHQVYACGAPIVVDSARAAYTQAGLPSDEFYADSFTSAADKALKRKRLPCQAHATPLAAP